MRYVDANIFISNLIGDNRVGEASRKYLEKVAEGKEPAVTSVHTMIEIYAFLKGKKLSEQKIAKILEEISKHGVTILQFEGIFLHDALLMVHQGWKLGDAIHYVTMAKHNLKEIVTDDKHFDDLEGIKRIDILKMNG